MVDEMQNYCIFAKAGDTTVALTIPLSQAQFEFFSNANQMQFTIGDGITVAFDRQYLDAWCIDLIQ